MGLEEGRWKSNPLVDRRAKIEETSANQISAINYVGHLENETTPLSTSNLLAPMQINAMRAISSPSLHQQINLHVFSS